MIRAIRPVTSREKSYCNPGYVWIMGGDVPVRACWYNQFTGELVPGDDPPGEHELDYPSLWWVAGLN